MKMLILFSSLLFVAWPLRAQDASATILSSTQIESSIPVPQYPATSWTYNIDFKDPDAYGPLIGRNLAEGQYLGGPVASPLSIYRVVDAKGMAHRWFRAGGAYLMNAEGANGMIAGTFGVEVLQWTSQASISGPISKAAAIYKPFGLTSITGSVHAWGGWSPRHDQDVAHDFGYGFGFQLTGKFGESAAKVARDILVRGL